MLIRLFFFLTSLSPALEERLWRWWYQNLAGSYRKNDWRFMNYGYAPIAEQPTFIPKNDLDRENYLSIQLYEHTLLGIDLAGKDVLEVGSGRGGGADYVARYWAPRSLIAVDFAQNAVELCNQFYQVPNLSFIAGNAEKLPLENDRFDVVYNVESSHCYGDMSRFIAEVTRVLKPGGTFAWADLRTKKAMDELEVLFANAPLQLISKEEITPSVLKALDLTSDGKAAIIQERVPYMWRSIFGEFAGLRDGKIYRGFQEGTLTYRCYRFRKAERS